MFRGRERTFNVLAAPRVGSSETCVRRVRLDPHAEGVPHRADREQIVLITAGAAIAIVAGVRDALLPGDTVIVPPDAEFSLANATSEPCEAVAVLPVGAKITPDGGIPELPAWLE